MSDWTEDYDWCDQCDQPRQIAEIGVETVWIDSEAGTGTDLIVVWMDCGHSNDYQHRRRNCFDEGIDGRRNNIKSE